MLTKRSNKTQKSAKEGSKSTASLGSQTAHASSSLSYVASAPDANGAAPAGGCTCRGESQLLGTALCPILNQVPMIEPLVCNRVSAERLSELFFSTTASSLRAQTALSKFGRDSTDMYDPLQLIINVFIFIITANPFLCFNIECNYSLQYTNMYEYCFDKIHVQY